jgi:hypothetical protein
MDPQNFQSLMYKAEFDLKRWRHQSPPPPPPLFRLNPLIPAPLQINTSSTPRPSLHLPIAAQFAQHRPVIASVPLANTAQPRSLRYNPQQGTLTRQGNTTRNSQDYMGFPGRHKPDAFDGTSTCTDLCCHCRRSGPAPMHTIHRDFGGTA